MDEDFKLSLLMQPDGQRIDATAATVSSWLDQDSGTRSVATSELVAELWSNIGVAAYDGEEPTAFGAARFSGLLDEAVVVTGDMPFTEKSVPHFCVGSVIVARSYRGQGLGGLVVGAALIAAQIRWYEILHNLHATEEPAAFALASAVVTSQASERLFTDYGFWPTASVEIAAAHGYRR